MTCFHERRVWKFTIWCSSENIFRNWKREFRLSESLVLRFIEKFSDFSSLKASFSILEATGHFSPLRSFSYHFGKAFLNSTRKKVEFVSFLVLFGNREPTNTPLLVFSFKSELNYFTFPLKPTIHYFSVYSVFKRLLLNKIVHKKLPLSLNKKLKIEDFFFSSVNNTRYEKSLSL